MSGDGETDVDVLIVGAGPVGMLGGPIEIEQARPGERKGVPLLANPPDRILRDGIERRRPDRRRRLVAIRMSRPVVFEAGSHADDAGNAGSATITVTVEGAEE